MKKTRKQSSPLLSGRPKMQGASGFSAVEFLVSTVVIMSLSASIFGMLTDVQSGSGYQTEVLSVMQNTRVAMGTLERLIVQAGNNPLSVALTPVTITSATEAQFCTDVTGSSGGNQGDPDGDIQDMNENVTVRYNQDARTLELVDGSGTVQTLATRISAFSLQYFDSNGNVTTTGTSVARIRVSVSGASTAADPRTRKTFGLTLTNDFTLPNQG